LLRLDDLIGQRQQLGLQSVELSAGFLSAFPGQSQFAHARSLWGRDAVKLVFAGLAASQDVGGMQVAFGATAGGFAAFAVHEVEASRDEFCGFGHLTQKGA
jgi:hypothetical protein